MDHPSRLITSCSDWDFSLIEKFDLEIKKIACDEFMLDVYPVQLEIITAEQMMDAYSSVGMPISYPHWSFGKHFVSTEKNYRRGHMGLAYEIVINSNPCIAYLMEENSMPMQVLVIAHAAYGHNSFFKNNYLFKSWTDADSIIDYLVFARKYIVDCEERYGVDAVEELLDSCHAIMNYGVDRYKRPAKLSLEKERIRQKEREKYLQSQIDDIWRTIPNYSRDQDGGEAERFPSEPQENLLYFIEKYAPLLEPWQREIVRIVRKMAQYFYPQRQTQVMNEGWATFWHYCIFNRLHEKGLVSDGFVMEFLQSHTNVIYQPSVMSGHYNGINPYALGFAIFQDMRRVCESPTDEDKNWFPDIAGSNWIDSLDFAMRNFKDESFIAQYLSPKVIRDFRFFSIKDDDCEDSLYIPAIHDDEGYQAIRSSLKDQYDLSLKEPNIQIWSVNVRGDRSLTMRYYEHNRRPVDVESAREVLKHMVIPPFLTGVRSRAMRPWPAAVWG